MVLQLHFLNGICCNGSTSHAPSYIIFLSHRLSIFRFDIDDHLSRISSTNISVMKIQRTKAPAFKSMLYR
jgi:hypothetical protein